MPVVGSLCLQSLSIKRTIKNVSILVLVANTAARECKRFKKNSALAISLMHIFTVSQMTIKLRRR